MDQHRHERTGCSPGDARRITGTGRMVRLPEVFKPDIVAMEPIGRVRHGMKHQHARIAEHRYGLRIGGGPSRTVHNGYNYEAAVRTLCGQIVRVGGIALSRIALVRPSGETASGRLEVRIVGVATAEGVEAGGPVQRGIAIPRVVWRGGGRRITALV